MTKIRAEYQVSALVQGGTKPLHNIGRISAYLCLITIICFASYGCSNSPRLGLQDRSATTGTVTQAPKKLAFAPIVGAPPEISQAMINKVIAAARARNIVVTNDPKIAEYLVRGYLVAAPEGRGTKLSYIWDINDKNGVRAHRILGNEFIPKRKGSNVWSGINDQLLDKISNIGATQLAGWANPGRSIASNQNLTTNQTLASNTPNGPQNIAPSRRYGNSPYVQRSTYQTTNRQPTTNTRQTTANRSGPITTASTRRTITPQRKVLAPKTTGSIAPTYTLARVAPVTGAPGDGRIALTNALRKELARQGVKMTTKHRADSYVVKGNVALGQPRNGSQKIEIVWQVIDPTGKRIGTVSQDNKIPQGALNKKWGRTATAAASAAAKGIVKLLPEKKK